ncbi:MAG: biotin transporter BioY [Alphaproteobacteria bacterium]
MMTTTHPNLQSVALPVSGTNKIAKFALLAIVGSIILAVSAHVKVPFYPVPITMQTMVVLMIGMAYGWKLGGATILLYLAEGAVGLPVFTNGGGVHHLAGPTAGYLFGFFAAATTIGWLAERGFDRSIAGTAMAMLVGTAIIYLFGVTWLSSLLGLEKGLQFGLYPFIYGDILKLVIAALAMPAAWSLLRK